MLWSDKLNSFVRVISVENSDFLLTHEQASDLNILIIGKGQMKWADMDIIFFSFLHNQWTSPFPLASLKMPIHVKRLAWDLHPNLSKASHELICSDDVLVQIKKNLSVSCLLKVTSVMMSVNTEFWWVIGSYLYVKVFWFWSLGRHWDAN